MKLAKCPHVYFGLKVNLQQVAVIVFVKASIIYLSPAQVKSLNYRVKNNHQ